jgi:3-carboxy-cis,cis-muconate cycloisomerase
VALALVDELAAELGLVAGALPWQVRRRPITSFADAATTLSDAYGLFATNVALLSRTEIGELGEPAEEGRGASSAMPQKQNPVLSVLIRSAALRAPDLAAGLHRAALSVDERPDGAWHSEWSPLRELLRLIGGEAELGAELAGGLRVDRERIAANLALSGPLLVSERLAVVLGPILGRKRLQSLIERSMADSAVSLAGLLRGEEGLAAMSDEQLHELLAPQNYVGAAGTLVDRALAHYRQTIADAPPPGESASRGVRA